MEEFPNDHFVTKQLLLASIMGRAESTQPNSAWVAQAKIQRNCSEVVWSQICRTGQKSCIDLHPWLILCLMLSCWDPRDKMCACSSRGLSSNLELHQCKGKHYTAQYLHYSGQGKNAVAAVNSLKLQTLMGRPSSRGLGCCCSWLSAYPLTFFSPFRDGWP